MGASKIRENNHRPRVHQDLVNHIAFKEHTRAKRRAALRNSSKGWYLRPRSCLRSWKKITKTKQQWNKEGHIKEWYAVLLGKSSRWVTTVGSTYHGDLIYKGMCIHEVQDTLWQDTIIYLHKKGVPFPMCVIEEHVHDSYYTPKGMYPGSFHEYVFTDIKKEIDKRFPWPW